MLFNNLSPSLKWKLYKLYRILYKPTELTIFQKHNNEIRYPRGRVFVGGGDFKKVGEEFFSIFKNYCNLQTNHRILDVGCGMGRMAIPLLNFLDEKGSYEGLDIFHEGIKWAKNNVSKNHSNFNFNLVDIYNSEYNPKGTIQASEYKFPYKNNTFDFIFATSLFTHLLPESLVNYFMEINRILKPGGNCLFTFLLLNDESKGLISNGKSSIKFEHNESDFRLVKKKIPEHTIAYEQSFILENYKKSNLKIIEPILFGSWCGRNGCLSYQDLIMAMKP